MAIKLFEPVDTAHDGKARVLFICQDKNGFYVFKPSTGFKTRHWESVESEDLQRCWDRQKCCTQNNGFFEPGENPAAEEDYSLDEVETVVITTEPVLPPVDETAAPVVKETLGAVIEETPAPVVEETAAPVVEETPVPVVDETPVPVVEAAPLPAVEEKTAPVKTAAVKRSAAKKSAAKKSAGKKKA